MSKCSATFRSRKTGKSRICGKPAEANGFCAKHQWVHEHIMRIHNDAVDSLSQDESEDEV